MDELRGPNIQIVLHVKEGLGFGFLRAPFLVSGSLNGYLLESDPAVPCHAPVFDAELVWEADKRRFRNLRVQNVPLKVEVYTTGSTGRKNKIGYLLLSLLGAQPYPSNKIVGIKHTWHRLLGVKAEGKCCHPQLMLGLTIEDRANTITPRNERMMFHSNEAASYLPTAGNMAIRPHSFTLEDYLAESKKTVTSSDLEPRLLVEEGLIQIGSVGSHLFVLSFVLGAAENVDTLLPGGDTECTDCLVTYSVFTHTIQTDRVSTTSGGVRKSTVQFNQRTSLRLCTDLSSLSRYFSECPHVVTRLCSRDRDIGLCSTDLRKLVPTEQIASFLSFCNAERAITVGERCYIMPCVDGAARDAARRPYIDVEISLKYIGQRKDNVVVMPGPLTARSATHLGQIDKELEVATEVSLEVRKSLSSTEVTRDVASVTYTNITARNTARNNANGDAPIDSQNEVVNMIKKMYESFTNSQEKMLDSMTRPNTYDIQVQCCNSPKQDGAAVRPQNNDNSQELGDETPRPAAVPMSAKSCLEKDILKILIPADERESLMKKYIEELEDWKEQQQELYKFQLRQKEEYQLETLSTEWTRRRAELEGKLSLGVEQCRSLAADLGRATEDFRLRGYRNTQREQKLLQAKQSLEQHYTGKLQELREASRKLEEDMKHQEKLKDMRIDELETRVEQLLKENENLRNSIISHEKEAKQKKSGLTKDQTASLIQELRVLEEKLEDAAQSKAFFKEQWGRAVRELHSVKLQDRRRMLTQLQRQRRHLGDTGNSLEDVAENEDISINADKIDLQKLKDDFYVNLLADTPPNADGQSTNYFPFPDIPETACERIPKKASNEKLNNLMQQRDKLIQKENPDEDQLLQLNHEIRNILLSCGT